MPGSGRSVRCPVSKLEVTDEMSGMQFALKFIQALEIAQKEPYRAVTHNKGIMNGIDAVVIATGNDFRAVEAGIHAYAARKGIYSSLSHAFLEGDEFVFPTQITTFTGDCGRAYPIAPDGEMVYGIIGQSQCQKSNGNCCSGRFGSKFCSRKVTDYFGNPKKAT